MTDSVRFRVRSEWDHSWARAMPALWTEVGRKPFDVMLMRSGTLFAQSWNMERRRATVGPEVPVARQDENTRRPDEPSHPPGERMRGAAEFSDILDRLSKGLRVPAVTKPHKVKR